MNTKHCPKCGETKPIGEFSRNRHNSGGWSGRCKICERIRNKAYRDSNRDATRARFLDYRTKNLDHELARQREYRVLNRDKFRARKLKYAAECPEKEHAVSMVHNAIVKGTLVRQPCEECGCEPAQGHHDDYSKPLEVRWLCRTHHARLHRGRLAG